MKSYIQLANIANNYYDAWTSDGIDTFHTDAGNIAAWLKREDLRTDADTELAELTDDEIEKVASMIADMAADNLKETVSAVVKETAALFDSLKGESSERKPQ